MIERRSEKLAFFFPATLALSVYVQQHLLEMELTRAIESLCISQVLVPSPDRE